MTAGESAGVVLVVGNLGVGGVVRVVLNFANHLAIPVAVAVRVPEGGLMPGLSARVPLFVLSSGTMVQPGLRSAGERSAARPPRGLTLRSVREFWRECAGLRRILRETGATTVSTFFMRGHLVALATRALMAPGIRVVINIHENVSERAAADYPRPLERMLMRLFVRRLFRRADAVVVPAGVIRDDLVTHHGAASSHVTVCRNPVDLDAIRAGAPDDVEPWARRAPGRHLLVGIGRLVDFKAYHVLVEALSLLPASLDAHAIIIGSGPEHDALVELARRLGVQERVHLIGNQANPWKYLARADVFVHPSRTEAQGLVFVESMALGVPVIATNASAGIRESLGEGRHGVMVPPDDPAALASAIDLVLSDRALRDSLVEGGHEMAGRFSLPSSVAQYERVLTGRPPTSDL